MGVEKVVVKRKCVMRSWRCSPSCWCSHIMMGTTLLPKRRDVGGGI